MSTSDKYVALTEKRLLGWQSLKEQLFDYWGSWIGDLGKRIFGRSATFTEIGIEADGANKFQLVDYFTDGTVSAIDGAGNLLNPYARETDVQDVVFENTNLTEYHVGIRRADIPSGYHINPADGMPFFDSYEEIIGWSGTPGSVTDNGNGTLTFNVNAVTQSGVSFAGRKVKVWKKLPGKAALTEAVGVEECTVAYSAPNNRITTVANFGQSSSASTTASDYVVVLVGPRVSTTDFSSDLDWCYLGTVTGAGTGNPPTTFDITNQYVVEIPLSQLGEVVRIEPSNDRLKVDVKALADESGIDQIRVTKLGSGTKFSVDENGNISISGKFAQRILPSSTGANLDIGSADDKFNNVYINGEYLGSEIALSLTGTTPGLRLTRTADTQVERRQWDIATQANGTLDFRGKDSTNGFISTWLKVTKRNAALNYHVADTIDLTAYTSINLAASTVGTSGKIVPTADGTLDLGESGKRFGTEYLKILSLSSGSSEGIITNFYPTADGTLSIGSLTRRFSDVNSLDLHIYGSSKGKLYLGDSAATGGVGCWSLEPSSTGLRLWARDSNFENGSVYLHVYRESMHNSRVELSLDFVPTVNLSYDFGASTLRWSTVFSGRLVSHVASGGAYVDLRDEAGSSTNESWRIVNTAGELSFNLPPDDLSTAGTKAVGFARSGTDLTAVTIYKGDLLPDTEIPLVDAQNLGSYTKRWTGIHGMYATFNSTPASVQDDCMTIAAEHVHGDSGNGVVGNAGGRTSEGFLKWYFDFGAGAVSIFIPFWINIDTP